MQGCRLQPPEAYTFPENLQDSGEQLYPVAKDKPQRIEYKDRVPHACSQPTEQPPNLMRNDKRSRAGLVLGMAKFCMVLRHCIIVM